VSLDNLTTDAESWREHLVDSGAGISRILEEMRRLAVVGIKTPESHAAAYSIPAELAEHGYDVVPVPVYYPEVTELLGQPVHRSLATIDPPADLILLFRRSSDIPQHVDDILAAKPRVVWMQQGIRNEQAAEQFAKAGIEVVQDRCIYTELGRRGKLTA
jgi:predicted CoA-binding protein